MELHLSQESIANMLAAAHESGLEDGRAQMASEYADTASLAQQAVQYPSAATPNAELIAATGPEALRAILAERAQSLAKIAALEAQIARIAAHAGAEVDLLRTAADDAAHALEVALASGPAPGTWRWWTSCSFRRLSSDATGGDGDVLHATVHRHDNHPDVWATEPTMDFIAAANPVAMRAILSDRVAAHLEVARLRALLPNCANDTSEVSHG